MPRFESQGTTDEQEAAFGHVIADHLGGHMQTSFDAETGVATIYTQMAPNETPAKWLIDPDGTVTRGG